MQITTTFDLATTFGATITDICRNPKRVESQNGASDDFVCNWHRMVREASTELEPTGFATKDLEINAICDRLS